MVFHERRKKYVTRPVTLLYLRNRHWLLKISFNFLKNARYHIAHNPTWLWTIALHWSLTTDHSRGDHIRVKLSKTSTWKLCLASFSYWHLHKWVPWMRIFVSYFQESNTQASSLEDCLQAADGDMEEIRVCVKVWEKYSPINPTFWAVNRVRIMIYWIWLD